MTRHSLDKRIDFLAKQVQFQKGFRLHRVSDDVMYDSVQSKFGIDQRARKQGDGIYCSTYNGLGFNSEKVTTQVYAVIDPNTENIAETVGFVISPREQIEDERYFRRIHGGFLIQDLSDITGKDFPDWIFSVGWTKVLPRHRADFTIKTIGFLRKVFSEIEKWAPENYWVREVARGIIAPALWGSLGEVVRSDKWFVSDEELERIFQRHYSPGENGEIPEGFSVKDFGKNSYGSNSTIKFAKRILGLEELRGISSFPQMGPVFIKKVK